MQRTVAGGIRVELKRRYRMSGWASFGAATAGGSRCAKVAGNNQFGSYCSLSGMDTGNFIIFFNSKRGVGDAILGNADIAWCYGSSRDRTMSFRSSRERSRRRAENGNPAQ